MQGYKVQRPSWARSRIGSLQITATLIVLVTLQLGGCTAKEQCEEGLVSALRSWPEFKIVTLLWDQLARELVAAINTVDVSVTGFLIADEYVDVDAQGEGQALFLAGLTQKIISQFLTLTVPGKHCLQDLINAGRMQTNLGVQLDRNYTLEFSRGSDGRVVVDYGSGNVTVVGLREHCDTFVYATSGLIPPPPDAPDGDELQLSDLDRNMFVPKEEVKPVVCPNDGQYLGNTTGQDPAVAPAPAPSSGALITNPAPEVDSSSSQSSGGSSFPVVAVVVPLVVVGLLAATLLAAMLVIRKRRRRKDAALKGLPPYPDATKAKGMTDPVSFGQLADATTPQISSMTISGPSTPHVILPLSSLQMALGVDAPPLMLVDLKMDSDVMLPAPKHLSDSAIVAGKSMDHSPASTTSTEPEILAEELNLIRGNDGQPVRLGHGGFGVVYKGIWNNTYLVAIKVASIHASSTLQNRNQLMREIGHLRTCKDDHIVRFVGVCFQGTDVMMVTEFMGGGDLFAALTGHKREEYMWKNKGRKIALDIVRSLCCLHGRGIVHCDIKPHNVLLDEHGAAKLADLGMSNVLMSKGYITQVSSIGTFAWAAPEMIMHQKVTPAVDIFSFGIVLWQMVKGSTPARGQVDVESLEGLASQDVLDMIAACLDVDPARRPFSDELLEVIKNHQDDVIEADTQSTGHEDLHC